jgi:protein TonB
MIYALAGLSLQAISAMPAPPAPPAPTAVGNAIRARPKAPLASLFSIEDYPGEAFRNRQQGSVGFRLQVGPDGRVKGCAIISSSGFESLDSTTCRLLTLRARFSPARDRFGKPTSDSAVGQINWRTGWKRLPR